MCVCVREAERGDAVAETSAACKTCRFQWKHSAKGELTAAFHS